MTGRKRTALAALAAADFRRPAAASTGEVSPGRTSPVVNMARVQAAVGAVTMAEAITEAR
jgi:hypothetical protein